MLTTQLYTEQVPIWPRTGRHILAQFDDETIIVYQAFRPEIGRHVAKHGRFGDNFSRSRMSWIKPNFLWMMFRSGWGTKVNQEVTLGLRLRRTFFDSLLAAAVPSAFPPACYATEQDWSQAVANSSVRLQWDPDHDPRGAKLERRAIQLGLRGQLLESFAARELVEVLDLSEFVAEQREILALVGIESLLTPRERVYVPSDSTITARVGLDMGQTD